ncbi:MAG TPA: translocation/assembly module TamB domain-containing protein [Alphaproteobacteria bacterium]|nr:translocation/assembly module TamB domain-containing protein [Alphaproteobacteria bacterium]
MRRVRAITIGLALAAACPVYLSAAVPISDPLLDPLRDYLVRSVAQYLSKSLDGSIEVEALRGSLFGSPVLHNVVARDAQGGVVGRIEEIRLEYNLLSLVRGWLTVNAVDIVRPQFTIVQERDGTLNIRDLVPSPPPNRQDSEDKPATQGPSFDFRLPFGLRIERLQVQDGRLDLRLPILAGVKTVEGLQARLSGRIDDQGLRAEVEQVTAHLTPADLRLEQVQGGFELSAGKAQIDTFLVRMGHTHFTAAGVVPWTLQPVGFELHLQPLDVGEIGRLLESDDLQGQVRVAVRAEGPPEAVAVNAELRTAEGRIALQGELNRVSTPMSYRTTLDVTDLDLTTVINRGALHSDLNLHARVDGSGLSLTGWRGEAQLHIEPSHLGEITLHPSDIHLVAQQERFEVRRFDLNTSAAHMTASGVLNLAGHSDLRYDLTAELADLQPLLDMQTLAGSLQLQGQAGGDWPALSVDGTLRARHVRYRDNRAQTLEVTYAGSALGAQPTIQTQMVARQLTASALPLERVGLGATYRGAAEEVRFAVEVVQSADAGGRANGVVGLSDQGQQAVVEELVVRLPGRTWHAPKPLQVTHQQRRLVFEQVRLVHDDEAIELSGAIDGEQLQDLRLRAAQIDLTYLQGLLELPEAVGGRASLEARLEGTVEAPVLHSELELWEGSPQQLPVEQLQASMVYAQRRLQADVRIRQTNREVLALDLRLPVDLALTALPLPQRLVDAPLSLSVEVKQPRLGLFRRWQPVLPPLSGTLQGTLSMQGTYAALAVDGDIRLQQLGVGDIVTQIEAPARLTAELVTAVSVQALERALQQGRVRPTLEHLVLRVPRLKARLPDRSGAPRPVDIRDLVLRASGLVSPDGLQATLQRFELQAHASGMPPAEFSMAAQLTPQRLELTSFQVRFPESEVHGQGQLTLATEQLQFRFEIPRLALDILPMELPPELSSVVSGVVLVGGSLQAPEVEARLRYAGTQIIADMAVQLQQPLPNYRMTVRVEGFRVARLLPERQGELSARLQLQGAGFTGEQRDATLDLTIDSSRFTLTPGLTVDLRATLAGDAIRLENFRLRSVPVDIVAGGTLSAARRAELTYALTLGDLGALESQLGIDLQAQGIISGTVEGPLHALQTYGRLRITDWRYAALRGQLLRAEFAAARLSSAPQASLEARLVGVQGPALPPSSLRLEGHYSSPQGTFRVTVTGGPYEDSLIAGNVSLDAGQQVILRRLRLQRGDLVWQNLGTIEMVRGPHGGLRLQRLVLQSGTQEISARARLTPGGAVQAEVHARQFRLQPAIQAIAPDTPAPEGSLSLDLTLDGTLDQPRARGNLDVTALAWQGHALGELHADLALRNQVLQIDLRWRVQDQELLQVRGTVGLSAESPLRLQVQTSRVDLTLLERISPAIADSEGALGLNVRVTGRLQQPQLYGSLRLDDGALQLRAAGERYRDIQVRVRFAGDRLMIERLHVGSRTGPLQLTGYIEYIGLSLQHIDLAMQAQEFTAVYTPAIQTVVSADLAIRGSLQEMAATGSVTVPQGRVLLDELPWGGPAEVKPWELTVPGVYGPGPEAMGDTDAQAATAAPGPGLSLAFLRVDLAVAMPGNFWVLAPSTAVELSGDLRVSKALDESLALSGSIDTVRGYASYYRKRFELEEGHVIFTGSEEINPRLDVTVSHTVAGYDIRVHVEGTLEEPVILFSSTPELPQTEIISLLVIGKTTDRLTNTERNIFANQLQQLAGAVIAGRLEEAIAARLGVEIIEITPGETLGTGTISAGRYLTQKLFVSIGQQFGEEAGLRIALEYSITPHLKLEVSSNDARDTAVDFLWRRDY